MDKGRKNVGGRGISSHFLCLKASISINVAYNYLVINNNSMAVDQAMGDMIIEGVYSYIPYDSEILDIFFKTNNIIVNWIDCNNTWGLYDYETGRWTGAIGKVKMTIFLLK